MGVAGSGKSTVGARLADALGLEFVDADTLHSPEAIAQMAAGTPLTEEQRGPWLDRCHEVLVEHCSPPHADGVVLACSALTAGSRRRLAGALPVRFVALIASEEALTARLAGRRGHFFDPALLASQLATLELDRGVFTVDAQQPVDAVVADARHALGR
jgi:gluconokinase